MLARLRIFQRWFGYRRGVVRPRRPDPPPLPVNDLAAVAVGTAAWLIALLVLLALHTQLARNHETWWLSVCGAGVVLGIAGLGYCDRRQRRLRRSRRPGDAGRPDSGTHAASTERTDAPSEAPHE